MRCSWPKCLLPTRSSTPSRDFYVGHLFSFFAVLLYFIQETMLAAVNGWQIKTALTYATAAAAVGSSALCEYLCAAVGPVVSQNTAPKHAAALHLRLCRKQLHLRQAPPRLSPATHVSEDHLPVSLYSGMLHPKAKPERNHLATGVRAPEQQPSRPCCSGRVQREAPWLPASAAGLRRYREGAPRCATLDVRDL